jgi:putative transposase
MVAAAIRTIFAQPTGAEVVEQVEKVAAMLAPKFPAVAAMLADAKDDLTAFASASRPPTGPRSGRPTRWSGSTRKSSAEPTWSVSVGAAV